jgi:hypothetical protein
MALRLMKSEKPEDLTKEDLSTIILGDVEEIFGLGSSKKVDLPLQASLKKDSDMKIDKTTYKDKKERQFGMTADHTSQPDKVLFFAVPHFLFFKSRHTNGTLPFARHTSQRFAKVKEPFFAHTHKEFKFTSINFNFNNYGNN